MKRTRKQIPHDILEIAADQLGHPEPSILFDVLLDAGLRALRPLPHQHPRRVEVLNLAMDRLYRELTEGATDPLRPLQHARAEVSGIGQKPEPKLKP